LFDEPFLVAAVLPTGKVHGVKVFAMVAEALDDVRIRETVLEHLINFVAKCFGEPGDVAVPALYSLDGVVRGATLGWVCDDELGSIFVFVFHGKMRGILQKRRYPPLSSVIHRYGLELWELCNQCLCRP
jgi:hypothetical protein